MAKLQHVTSVELNHRVVRTSLKGLCSEKQHPHVLKHSIATHLVSANVNLALVKQQLGHKSINSTIRYVTMSDQQASKATAGALMKIY
jgi:site-specific recombinase XerD